MSTEIPVYVVDAFSSTLFAGNPAAVCPLEKWLPEQTMLNIAAENNYAETAFLVGTKNAYRLRWFTPRVEVELCGHATLATAFVLSSMSQSRSAEFRFNTLSGELVVTKEADLFMMDFPARTLEPLDLKSQVSQCIGVEVLALTRAEGTWIAELKNETQVNMAVPDQAMISRLECTGLIITAAGDEVDFVSRFFAPRVGIDEDSVTGSAHCGLVPYWHRKLGKSSLQARQNSTRGGEIHCEYRGDRVIVGGKAVLFSKGTIYLP